MNWIKTKDKLPDEGQLCLAAVSDPLLSGSHDLQTAIYSKGKFLDSWKHEDINYFEGSVTHWMPLPEKPEK